MQNHIKNRRKEVKRAQREKHRGGVKFALVTVRGPSGEPELVFREISNKKRPEELREIYIGKPETQQQEEGEDLMEEDCNMDNMDDDERQFLQEFMGDDAQVEEFHEMEDVEEPEVIERHYEIKDQYDDVPIIEEKMEIEDMEQISEEFDLRSAPVVKLSQTAEDFLARQLFGDNYNEVDTDDACEKKKIQDGMDFFTRDIRPHRLEEIDQRELHQIKAHVRDAVEYSEGSDLAMHEDDMRDDSCDFEECSGEMDELNAPQFKVKRPRRERIVTLDMVNDNRLAEEDIQRYIEKAAAETQEIADESFKNFVEQNTRTLTQEERLEDQYVSRPETMKRRIAESAMITITKTGVPQNVYTTKQRQEVAEEEPGQEYIRVVMPHNRDKNESVEDRRARKELVKEAKKIRKDQKRDLKNQFAQAKGTARRHQDLERQNLQGRRLD